MECAVCKGSGVENLYRCVGSYLTPDVIEVANLAGLYEAGSMPDPGGIYEQAAPYIDLVRLFEGERSKVVAEHQRSKAKK